MAYGIRFDSANGKVQLDSATTNTGIIITDSAVSSQYVTFDQSKEFCFAKPAATSYSGEILMALRMTSGGASGGWNADQLYYFEKPDGTRVTANYIVGRWSNQITDTSTGYGIKIFNSDGDVAYNSKLYAGDGGFGILSFFPASSLSGEGPSGGSASRLTTDTTKYVDMNGTFGSGDSSGFFGYSFKRGTGAGIYYSSYITITVMGGNSVHTIGNFTPRFLGEAGSV
jgi:hypothetical protein|tara:strand:- start:441 stop:1121 length:681 start_codon:yes stop_codon:yes gene_type:complete